MPIRTSGKSPPHHLAKAPLGNSPWRLHTRDTEQMARLWECLHVVGHVNGVQLVGQEAVAEVHALLLPPGVDGDDADVHHHHHPHHQVVLLQDHVGHQGDQVQGFLLGPVELNHNHQQVCPGEHSTGRERSITVQRGLNLTILFSFPDVPLGSLWTCLGAKPPQACWSLTGSHTPVTRTSYRPALAVAAPPLPFLDPHTPKGGVCPAG